MILLLNKFITETFENRMRKIARLRILVLGLIVWFISSWSYAICNLESFFPFQHGISRYEALIKLKSNSNYSLLKKSESLIDNVRNNWSQ